MSNYDTTDVSTTRTRGRSDFDTITDWTIWVLRTAQRHGHCLRLDHSADSARPCCAMIEASRTAPPALPNSRRHI
jgi:hypothetical protein